jgi:methanesulfonate monooxygenase small subunit
METPMTLNRTDVEELVYDTCLKLDARDWRGFLDLCTNDFTYKVTAFAPEIRKEMTWLDRDRAELQEFVGMLPKHNTDPSPLTRHAQVWKVKMNGSRAEIVSSLQIYRTALDGGASELYALGKYYDTVALDGEAPRLVARHVKLDTRDLGWGTHLPL